MSTGWVKIHRKFLDWGWYSSSKHKSVFLDLLIHANYEPSEFMGIKRERGQLTTSYGSIASRCGLTVQNVRTVLKDLISTREVTVENKRICSLITIACWDDYQLGNTEANTQVTSVQHSPNSQVTTTKKLRSKEVKNKEKTPPTSSSKKKTNEPITDDDIYNSFPVSSSSTKKEKISPSFDDWDDLVRQYYKIWGECSGNLVKQKKGLVSSFMRENGIDPSDFSIAIDNKTLVMENSNVADCYKHRSKIENFLDKYDEYRPENFNIESFYDFSKRDKMEGAKVIMEFDKKVAEFRDVNKNNLMKWGK